MKKILTLICSLVILSITTVVPTLGQDAAPSLTIWLMEGFVPDANEVVERQISDWAETNNVNVEFEFLTYGNYFERYITALENGELPDIGEIPSDLPLRLADQLLDVSDVIADVTAENGEILPNVAPIVQVGDSYIAVPRYSPTSVLLIRSDLMQEQGLEPPTTWDEFEPFVKALNDPENGVYGFGQTLNQSLDATRFLDSLIWSFGGSIFNEAGEPDLSQEENVEAFQFAVDMMNEWGTAPPDAMTWDDSGNNQSYLAGESATVFNGASLYYAMIANETTLDDGTVLAENTIAVPLPGGKAGRAVTSVPFSWSIFNHTENPELARDLIRYLEDPAQFEDYLVASVGQAGPVYENRFNSEYWESDPNYAAILQAVRDGFVLGYPGELSVLAEEVEGHQLLVEAVQKVLNGSATVEEALQELQEQIENLPIESESES